MDKDTQKYEYTESAWYSLLHIACIALDLCFLPYLLQLSWNQSFVKLHDSIHEIDWKTAFMLRASIWFLGDVFTKVTGIFEYQRRFYHFANMVYNGLPSHGLTSNGLTSNDSPSNGSPGQQTPLLPISV